MRRGRRGSASLEFALAAGPLLALTFGFIAANGLFYTKTAMQTAALRAARLMATGQVKTLSTGALTAQNTTATTACGPSLTTTQVEYHACAGLPSWATYSVTATLNCAVPSVTVQVSASSFTRSLGDMFGTFTGRTVTAEAVLMKEGQCP